MKTPSVTTILRPWTALGFEKIPESRQHLIDQAAQRGTEVHQGCATLARGLFPMNSSDTEGYIRSFRGWIRRAVDEVLAVEQYLETYHPIPFCGTPDLIVRIRGESEPAVVDLKTPTAASRAWALQLAGYRWLAIRNGYSIGRVFSLRLDSQGGHPKADEHRDKDIHLERFIEAARLYHFFHS